LLEPTTWPRMESSRAPRMLSVSSSFPDSLGESRVESRESRAVEGGLPISASFPASNVRGRAQEGRSERRIELGSNVLHSGDGSVGDRRAGVWVDEKLGTEFLGDTGLVGCRLARLSQSQLHARLA
jgi:hypothetical protein